MHEKIAEGLTDLKYVPSADNTADLFTKRLPGPRIFLLSKKVGIKDLKLCGT